MIKFAGDGVILVVDSSYAADAINCSIKVVEAFAEAAAPRRGQFTGDVTIEVSVGIATGQLLRFQPPEGGIDHVGPVMDIAARLCAMASPNAILVDTITVKVANMGKVSSRHGVLTHRTPAEYRGDRELVKMKGIPEAFPYHKCCGRRTFSGSAPKPSPRRQPAVRCRRHLRSRRRRLRDQTAVAVARTRRSAR